MIGFTSIAHCGFTTVKITTWVNDVVLIMQAHEISEHRARQLEPDRRVSRPKTVIEQLFGRNCDEPR